LKEESGQLEGAEARIQYTGIRIFFDAEGSKLENEQVGAVYLF
jgi:hypothetical protein